MAQSNNYTTNYSSQMAPPISASQLQSMEQQHLKQSEMSVINVAVGESAFVNSNVGLTHHTLKE